MRFLLFLCIFTCVLNNASALPLHKSIQEYADNIVNEEPEANSDKIEKTLISKFTKYEPHIDGKLDPIWKKSKKIVVWDNLAKQNIVLRSLHTKEKVYFLVTYADKTESRDHKLWTWSSIEDIYVEGPQREDTFVFKWSMEDHDVDLSVYADNDYKADIWFWKAGRTDPVGYADDKLHILSHNQDNKSAEMETRTKHRMFLTRTGDEGLSAYHSTFPVEYTEDVQRKYIYRQPTLSRADVIAKGEWGHGLWVIEFCRNLKTGNEDDVQFELKKDYSFGVSLFEIGGKLIGHGLEQPLYGCGDVYNKIKLKFE